MSGVHDQQATSNELLTDLLKSVSRSFYLTLRVLPAPVRRPVSIAYLLARASDTVADTDLFEPTKRLDSLNELDQAIQGNTDKPCHFDDYLSHQSKNNERELLKRSRECLALLNSVDDEDRRLIRSVLQTIISGQRLDLERFNGASKSQVICLQTAADTDDYTYRVAGCVGEFWTKVCFKHLTPEGVEAPGELVQQGIRFGKGLQLVNILRDLEEDIAQGRCYLPADRLASEGLEAATLQAPELRANLSRVYQEYIQIAQAHLRAGWEYTHQIPWTWVRVRLACAWPILLGFKTLDLLPNKAPLEPSHRAKVSRADVKKIIAKSLFYYPFPPLWRNLPGRAHQVPSAHQTEST